MTDPRAALPWREAELPASPADLAEGLLLIRASTVKMLRLQLAMERRDQAVALQAVDDLVALDDRLALLLGNPPGGALEPLVRDLEEQRFALQREKFGLAAAFVKRSPEAAPHWIERASEPLVQDEAMEPLPDRPREPGSSVRSIALWIAAGFLCIVAALAAAGLVLGWDPTSLLPAAGQR
jgi:hypothetical protein